MKVITLSRSFGDPGLPPRLSLSSILVLAIIFLPLFWFRNVDSVTDTYTKRMTGNPTAAGDLYGLGVRVGLYLQTLGMLLSFLAAGKNSDQDKKSGAGLKLAISANMLAILFSTVTLIRRKTISPCETWLVLTLIHQLIFASWSALCNPYTVLGEGLGIFTLCFANVAVASVALQFWATTYSKLPLLGTPNLAWFYVNVVLNHWFRIFSLVFTSLSIVFNAMLIFLVRPLMVIAWEAWWSGKKKDVTGMDWLRSVGIFITIFVALPVWVMTIAGAEEIIKANHLTPQTDLSQPGQSIPLAIGIITSVDGFAALVRLFRGMRSTASQGDPV
jgi:hypothetical protein